MKITKRKDGLYMCRVPVDKNGVRTYKSVYGRSELEVMQHVTEGQNREQNGRTFDEVADEWKEKHFAVLANGTKMCYSPALARAKDALGARYIKDITAADCYRVIMSQSSKSAKTVKTQKTVLGMIFSHGVISGDIDTNPVTDIRVPRGLSKKIREPASEQQIKTIESSLSCHFGLFAFLLIYSGLRRGEALALQYKDIDRKQNLIHVTKSVYFENNRPHIKQPKTEAGYRDVPLLAKLKTAIPRGKSEEYLFGGSELMSETAFQCSWERYCKEAGLVEPGDDGKMTHAITPHQIRHAYATILYEAGIDEFSAKNILGHSDIRLTQNIYTHYRRQKQDAARNALNSYTQKGQNVQKLCKKSAER